MAKGIPHWPEGPERIGGEDGARLGHGIASAVGLGQRAQRINVSLALIDAVEIKPEVGLAQGVDRDDMPVQHIVARRPGQHHRQRAGEEQDDLPPYD